jgi:hypothetical protein
MGALDEPVRKHLANIRSDYSRKTQELAEARKEIEAERTKVQQEREKFLNSDAYKRVKELAETNLDGVDMYTDEGIKKAIEKEAAKLMQAHFSEYEQQVQEVQSKQKVQQVKQEFSEELKDPDVRAATKDIAQKYPEMDIREAVLLAIQMAKPKQQERLRLLQAQEQERVRKGLIKTSTGKGEQLTVPDFNKMTPNEVASYLGTLTPEQHEQALKIYKSRKRGY